MFNRRIIDLILIRLHWRKCHLIQVMKPRTLKQSDQLRSGYPATSLFIRSGQKNQILNSLEAQKSLIWILRFQFAFVLIFCCDNRFVHFLFIYVMTTTKVPDWYLVVTDNDFTKMVIFMVFCFLLRCSFGLVCSKLLSKGKEVLTQSVHTFVYVFWFQKKKRRWH